MRILTGTSGWSYPEWKGHFYPEKIAARDMLRFYAQHFGAVEVNNTFYRMPKPEVLEGWASEVPEHFALVLKASKRITHDRRLNDVAEPTGWMLRAGAVLGPRLGPYLVQLPPNFKKDITRLREFLKLLEAPARAAFEFRNATWFDDEVYATLRERGAAWCIADTGEEGDPPFVSTADWGYLRLRRVEYAEGDLENWARLVKEQGWREAYVFFKHEDEATGPKLAARFMEMCGPEAAVPKGEDEIAGTGA